MVFGAWTSAKNQPVTNAWTCAMYIRRSTRHQIMVLWIGLGLGMELGMGLGIPTNESM